MYKSIILAVDDDNVILTTVKAVLSDKYIVIPFNSGQKMLNYLDRMQAANKPLADLILLDFNMPEMSGLEVLGKIIDNPQVRNIPVVFLTGSADADEEVMALSMGASDYVSKPIRPQSLKARIKMHLELLNYHRNLEQLVESKTKTIQDREDVTLNMLARVTDLRDSHTGKHIERTTKFAECLVNDLLENPHEGYRLTKEEAADLVRSMKLHDLGKIAIPDDVLLKKGKLTDEEFEVIKKHTVYGDELFAEFANQLGDDTFLSVARTITHSHHEKWNGKGYPQGLSGTDIPIAARIAAIADVYDALTSERPYKPPYSHEKATDIIVSDSGQHFDPYLIQVFQRHLEEFRKIAHDNAGL